MATITGIVPCPDRPGYVVILVDGAPYATVPAAGAEHAEGAPAAQKTYERALRLLSFRARSAKELEKRLLEKGEPAAGVAAALARLAAAGLLDDTRYAEARARTGIVGKARSRRRIEEDLVHRGVAREVAGAAVRRALADAGTDEAAVAERAARKKMRSLASLDPRAQREKLYAFLARQGHPASVVRQVVRAVLATSVDESDE
jgi:regulatory protein